MAIFFDVSEIYQFAINIEENGEKFYRKVAEKFDDTKVKEIFIFLADEEAKHKKTFEKLLEGIKNYQPSETYPGEYFAYLKAYSQELIFSTKLEEKIGKEIGTIEAINFGIKREVDSILYYTEVKNFVPETQHSQLDKIIEQERQHFIKLSALKEKIKGGK